MTRLVHAALLALCACGSSAPPAQPSPGKRPLPDLAGSLERAILPAVQVRGEEVRHTLADRMALYRIPGMSVAVFDDYELVWAKGYGIADRDTGEPVTEATLFQAGSISKSVNALAVMLLVAEGRLGLDAPINTLLRSWQLPDNDLTRASPVTLRRLLSHSAGTTVHGFPGYPSGAPVPTIVQVLDGQPPANTAPIRVDLAPGTQFRYSGGGTTITQLVLIDQLGKPYPDILAERVLVPLGMTSSSYRQPLPADWLPRAAAGHRADGSVVPSKRHVYPEMAAAGLWTTPSDLVRFLREVALARAKRSTRLSQEVAKAMTTEVVAGSRVGLGFFMPERNGIAMFGHNGADEGFQAIASASLDQGYGLVVMVNSDNGFRLFPEIERTIAAAMGWPSADRPVDRAALTAAQRDRLLGRYTLGEGGPTIAITAEGDQLRLERPLFPAVDMVALSADELVRVDEGVRCRWLGDDVIVLVAPDGSPAGRAIRMPPDAVVPLVELAAGRFDAALAAWRAEIAKNPAAAAASEQMHNQYGYLVMLEGNPRAATELFKLIVAMFPDSSNAHDSLGEGLMNSGETAAAIAAYEAAIAKLDADPRIPADQRPARRAHAEQQLARLRAPASPR